MSDMQTRDLDFDARSRREAAEIREEMRADPRLKTRLNEAELIVALGNAIQRYQDKMGLPIQDLGEIWEIAPLSVLARG